MRTQTSRTFHGSPPRLENGPHRFAFLPAALAGVLALLFVSGTAWAGALAGSISKSPVAPGGMIAGEPTEFVLNFNVDMNPTVDGLTLLNGKTIKVTLPSGFTAGNPLREFKEAFSPGWNAVDFNTAVMLNGWPQNPVPPPRYTVDYLKDSQGNVLNANTIVITAKQDLIPRQIFPGAPTELQPGIKTIHFIVFGYTNPAAGFYPIKVEAETGPNGSLQTDWVWIHITPTMRPSINLTTLVPGVLPVTPPPRPNTIYQTTQVGQEVPLTWHFLNWDKNGQPFDGVEILAPDPDVDNLPFAHGLLVHNQIPVGFVLVQTPSGATGMKVWSLEPSFLGTAPITGFSTAILRSRFRAGSLPGKYQLHFGMFGGNLQTMHVQVNP